MTVFERKLREEKEPTFCDIIQKKVKFLFICVFYKIYLALRINWNKSWDWLRGREKSSNKCVYFLKNNIFKNKQNLEPEPEPEPEEEKVKIALIFLLCF